MYCVVSSKPALPSPSPSFTFFTAVEMSPGGWPRLLSKYSDNWQGEKGSEGNSRWEMGKRGW